MTATHLHFDCYCGISGDMTLGALVELGADLGEIRRYLASVPVGPFGFRAERVNRHGLMGTRLYVEVEEDPHAHRHLFDVLSIIEASKLPPRVIERAGQAYRLLAEAEARAHGSTPESIHFHEVGARDAILDVAGAMLAVELLGAETFSAAPITVGFGMVKCRHGMMPIPAPATAKMLEGMPQRPGQFEGEMVTPTGAAILATLLNGDGGLGFITDRELDLVAVRTGYGAGARELDDCANYLRVLLCEGPGTRKRRTATAAEEIEAELETVLLLECEIDDMTPELAGFLMDSLFDDGALDVQFTTVQMKKNRPGLGLRVICPLGAEARLAERIFRETSTFGLRRSEIDRYRLNRREEQVRTDLGEVAVKVGLWGETVIKASPEYESCRALAREHGVPLAEVMDQARAAIRARFGS